MALTDKEIRLLARLSKFTRVRRYPAPTNVAARIKQADRDADSLTPSPGLIEGTPGA
jgi:hypothetical protein